MAKRNRNQIQADARKVLEDHPGGIRWTQLLKLTHADDPDTPWNSVHGGIHALLTTARDIVKVDRGIYRLAKFADAQPLDSHVNEGETATVEVQLTNHHPVKVSEANFYESFASWLIEGADEVNAAVVIGGSLLKGK